MLKLRSFRWVWCWVVVLFLAQPRSAWCQAGDLQTQLNSQYKGKTFLLRKFYSGKFLKYDADGSLLGTAPSDSWTLASYRIERIMITPQSIEIAGNRLGTAYDSGKRGLEKIGKLTIDVAIPDISKTTPKDVDSIFSKIFIQPGEDLKSTLPEYWECAVVESNSDSKSEACRATMDQAKAIVFKPNAGLKVKPPRAIYSPDPAYTKEAHDLHLEGVSVLWLVIDATGTPQSIRIVRPLGMGLDEQAIQTVAKWKFEPAKRDGQPVAVQINIELQFKVFP